MTAATPSSALAWVLLVHGTTLVVTESAIAAPIRDFARWIRPSFGRLVTCSMCFGFWIGVVYAAFGIRIVDGGAVDPAGVLPLVENGFAASGVCWLLHLVARRLEQGVGV